MVEASILDDGQILKISEVTPDHKPLITVPSFFMSNPYVIYCPWRNGGTGGGTRAPPPVYYSSKKKIEMAAVKHIELRRPGTKHDA